MTPAVAAAGVSTPGWRGLYPFASHWLDVDGHRLHYVDEGPRDAPVLLCLHGNPTWSFFWRHVVLALRDRYRVIALDHLGCGLSDKPQDWPYRLAGHVDNAERLVRSLGLERFTLVLHDWGGAIGMGVAARLPERVARLVVMNTAAFPSPAIPLRIAICRIPLLGDLAVRGLNGFARAATVMATTRGLPSEVRDGFLAPYDSWATRVATLRFVQDIPMDPGHPSWPELAHIEAALPTFRDRPMLIVWGERDWCFTPAFREEWQRRFPQAEVHALPTAGHYLIEDETEAVTSRLAAFLERTA
jgi:pimeloyl-ACP methyl ester carboxylesterase